jgi:hypothetical protein
MWPSVWTKSSLYELAYATFLGLVSSIKGLEIAQQQSLDFEIFLRPEVARPLIRLQSLFGFSIPNTAATDDPIWTMTAISCTRSVSVIIFELRLPHTQPYTTNLQEHRRRECGTGTWGLRRGASFSRQIK